jgi:hypothetical protein
MPRQASIVIAIFSLLCSVTVNAGQQIWQDMTLEQARSRGAEPGISYFNADDVALRDLLGLVPHRSSGDLSHKILLPMPDRSLAWFVTYRIKFNCPCRIGVWPGFKSLNLPSWRMAWRSIIPI